MNPTEGKEIVDIHSHILPGVDDGSESMETSLEMLKIATSEGITRMIATPHYKNHHHSVGPEKAAALLSELSRKASEENIKIKLSLGNEVLYFSDIEEAFEEKKFSTMCDKDYLFIEFYPDEDFSRIRDGVETVMSMGLTPILAHVERYMVLRKDLKKIDHLKNMGALITVNADSILGDTGFSTKQFIKSLLKLRYVDMVGTDSHDTSDRAPKMDRCRKYLYSKYDEQYVDDILFANAIKLFEMK